jgi:hypothetical protein
MGAMMGVSGTLGAARFIVGGAMIAACKGPGPGVAEAGAELDGVMGVVGTVRMRSEPLGPVGKGALVKMLGEGKLVTDGIEGMPAARAGAGNTCV